MIHSCIRSDPDGSLSSSWPMSKMRNSINFRKFPRDDIFTTENSTWAGTLPVHVGVKSTEQSETIVSIKRDKDIPVYFLHSFSLCCWVSQGCHFQRQSFDGKQDNLLLSKHHVVTWRFESTRLRFYIYSVVTTAKPSLSRIQTCKRLPSSIISCLQVHWIDLSVFTFSRSSCDDNGMTFPIGWWCSTTIGRDDRSTLHKTLIYIYIENENYLAIFLSSFRWSR